MQWKTGGFWTKPWLQNTWWCLFIDDDKSYDISVAIRWIKLQLFWCWIWFESSWITLVSQHSMWWSGWKLVRKEEGLWAQYRTFSGLFSSVMGGSPSMISWAHGIYYSAEITALIKGRTSLLRTDVDHEDLAFLQPVGEMIFFFFFKQLPSPGYLLKNEVPWWF